MTVVEVSTTRPSTDADDQGQSSFFSLARSAPTRAQKNQASAARRVLALPSPHSIQHDEISIAKYSTRKSRLSYCRPALLTHLLSTRPS